MIQGMSIVALVGWRGGIKEKILVACFCSRIVDRRCLATFLWQTVMSQFLFRVLLLIIPIRTVALVVIKEVVARSWFTCTIRTIIWVVALVVSILGDLIVAF
jgi:hypothetical protein